MDATEPTEMEQAIEAVSTELDADVILYNGPIIRPYDSLLIQACRERRKRENVLLILVTEGGDAHAAYRIAKCLQTKYGRFFLYVSGYCKSAGTLIATGAHELIMADHGELGPLDVQLDRKDELWETQSGLEITDTLDALRANAFSAFEKCFLTIKARSGGTITLRMAMQMATEMTTGLFSPIYSQVNPLSVGEAGRAMSIATSYGKILIQEGQNIGEEALTYIITSYPSHGFVIDRGEAKRLFETVQEPTQLQVDLADRLRHLSLFPDKEGEGEGKVPFEFLSTELSDAEGKGTSKNTGGNHDANHESENSQESRHSGPLEDAPGQLMAET